MCWRYCEERVGWQVCLLTGGFYESEPVNSVAFSSDGKRIVSCSKDTLIKIWDAPTLPEVNSFVEVRVEGGGVMGVFVFFGGGGRTCLVLEVI